MGKKPTLTYPGPSALKGRFVFRIREVLMRRHFTATGIRSRLNSDHQHIILDIDGANAAVSVGFTPEILKR